MKFKNIKKYLLSGLFGILPLSITVWVIFEIFTRIAEPGKGIITQIIQSLGLPLPPPVIIYLLSFVIMIILIIILGVIISNVFGKRLFIYFEKLFVSIPIVSNVYTTIRQIINTFSKDKNLSFQKVGVIEYPRKGLWAICFITGETKGKNNNYYNIFIPTTPLPTSGYFLYIKKEDVREVNLSVEEAMKIIISGGMISSDNIDLE